jgi:hypothetical protein
MARKIEEERELQDYIREKRAEEKRIEGEATVDRSATDRRGFGRAARRSRRDVPPDAEGQAERGSIDQIITDRGYTS